ncbi:hypothetical protein DENSPDRAFT_499425 [Dentipellis sp. KUC8613]|nr:hypothetical protein DENSPDRAFT_499425 [Dentipellis sp. KUC8613]
MSLSRATVLVILIFNLPPGGTWSVTVYVPSTHLHLHLHQPQPHTVLEYTPAHSPLETSSPLTPLSPPRIS